MSAIGELSSLWGTPPEAIELAAQWVALPKHHQDAVKDLIRTLGRGN